MICRCFLLFFFLVFLVASAPSNDPSCNLLNVKYGSANTYVICRGEFLPVETLKITLQNFTEAINTFELRNTTIDVLPEDMFGDVQSKGIQKIIFSHSTIELLQLPEMQHSPFKSVENTLESLEIYDSSSVFAWDISVFASLKKLEKIIIENSELFEVKNVFGNLPNLRLVQLINSRVKWIHPEAFKNLRKLTFISLSNNHITKVQRSMFSQPAHLLWSLDLSFNRLRELPKDIFDDMPSLHELKLDNNHLNIFPVGLVEPMWNQLNQLWLDGNNVLCWLFCKSATKEHRPMFMDSSKCRIGKSLRLDEFYSLCKNF